MPFTKVGTNTYKSPSGRTFTKKQVKMYYATNGFQKKKKIKLTVNNKLKGALGSSGFKGKGKPTKLKPTGKIEINVKAHKGDKAELASTIKHEMLHVKHPTWTEKKVYKSSQKTKISPMEQSKLISKLRMKSLNYKSGAMKRKFKMGNGKTEAGAFITKMNESKRSIIKSNKPVSKKRIAIMGLV